MSNNEINILGEDTFTIARVGDRIAAVGWSGRDGLYYIADGTGAASTFTTEEQAMGRLTFIAARFAEVLAVVEAHKAEAR